MITFDWTPCPSSKNGEMVRWDTCIARRLEAMKSGRRSKCNRCPKPKEFVKALVEEIL